jgi:hypothetical protein
LGISSSSFQLNFALVDFLHVFLSLLQSKRQLLHPGIVFLARNHQLLLESGQDLLLLLSSPGNCSFGGVDVFDLVLFELVNL